MCLLDILALASQQAGRGLRPVSDFECEVSAGQSGGVNELGISNNL